MRPLRPKKGLSLFSAIGFNPNLPSGTADRNQLHASIQISGAALIYVIPDIYVGDMSLQVFHILFDIQGDLVKDI